MNSTLVIVYVVSSVIDTVRVVRRDAGDATENAFLDRVIRKAQEIVRKSTVSGFDEDNDSCGIFAVDEATGESHEVWAMGVQDERA